MPQGLDASTAGIAVSGITGRLFSIGIRPPEIFEDMFWKFIDVASRAHFSPKARQVRDEPPYSIDNIEISTGHILSTFGRGRSAECPIRFARFRLADDSV